MMRDDLPLLTEGNLRYVSSVTEGRSLASQGAE
jgi:hypothetical protein